MKKIILCDIDGTIADNTHRQGYLKNKPKNWKAYNQNMHLDKPIEEVIWLISELYNRSSSENIIVFVTGREQVLEQITKDWLYTICRDFGFKYDNLYMRKEKDYRDDAIVKYELWQQIKEDYKDIGTPYLVLDDRDKVVKMWRENGLKCLQCNYGDF